MKEWLNLTKILIDESWGISQFRYNQKHDKKAFFKQLGLILLVLIALLPMFIIYLSLMVALYLGLSYLGQASFILSLGFIATSIVIIIFGIMQIISEFYFSKNIEELLPLPLSAQKIILAKFSVVLFPNYMFTAFAFLPILMIYGMGQGMGLLYLILSTLVFLCLPIIPLALITAITMLVMKGTARGRKDVIQIIFSFILVIAIFTFQFGFASQLTGLEGIELQRFLQDFLQNNEVLLNNLTYIMPTSIIVAFSLSQITFMSFIWILLLMVLTFLSIMVLQVIGKKFYLSSLVSGSHSKKGKRLSQEGQQKLFNRENPAWLSVFLMDFKIITQTPIFLFNNVSVVVIVPVIFLLALSFSGIKAEDFIELRRFYQENSFVFNYILIGFFAFFATSSATTATSFSREGKASWLTRIIPVSARDQIIGRSLTAVAIQGLGMLITLLAVIYYLPLNLSTILISTILGLAMSVPILFFGLLMDMNRPLLNWDNPQKAVKNNLNVIFTLFAGTFYVGLIGGISFLIGYFSHHYWGYLSIILLNALVGKLLYRSINQRLEKRLIELGD